MTRLRCLDRMWEELVQIPLDELDRYYALPWGVAITPDKSKIFRHHRGIAKRHSHRCPASAEDVRAHRQAVRQ